MKRLIVLTHAVLVSAVVVAIGTPSLAQHLSRAAAQPNSVSQAKHAVIGSNTQSREQEVDLLFQQGIGNYLIDQNQTAIAKFTEAIEIDASNPDYYVHRGISFREIGQPELAIRDFDRAIQLQPDYAFAYYNKGVAMQMNRDFLAASQTLKRSAELYQDQGNQADSQIALETLNQVQILSQNQF